MGTICFVYFLWRRWLVHEAVAAILARRISKIVPPITFSFAMNDYGAAQRSADTSGSTIAIYELFLLPLPAG